MRRCLPLLIGAWVAIATLAGDGECGAAAAEPSFGTLFHTPQQRKPAHALQRRSRTAQVDGVQGDRAIAGGSETLELNGVLIGSEGQQVVWINGAPHTPAPPEGLAVAARAQPPGAVLVVPGRAGEVVLGVGQRYDVGAGRIEEAYTWRKVADPQDAEPRPAESMRQDRRARPHAARPSLHLHVHTGPVRRARRPAPQEDDR